jgi:amidase
MSELYWDSATRLRDRIRDGEISSREVVDACLARIAEVNPRLNAVVALRSEHARHEADAADRAREKGELAGPLHGVPMTIKDSFDTAGLVSTWGTTGRRKFVPATDATAVRRLREAGAILLGKTNTPEFTLGFHASNSIYGDTRNPYDLERSPGGSSGGAAAIVAAGGSPFDIGTDTGGSIRQPCHFCGIAGIRPSSGRVPRTGHAIGPGGPIEALTQPGPMARRVEDLRLLLPILAGPDGRDPAIAPVELGDPDAVELSRLRVAFFSDNGIASPTAEVAAAVHASAQALSKAGAHVEELRPPGVEETQQLFAPLLVYDGGAWIRLLLERAGTSLEETSIGMSRIPAAPSFENQARVFERWEQFRERMLAFMGHWDAILSPPAALPAIPLADVDRVSMDAFSYTMTWNLTGYPGAVVRAGTSPEGLPIGVMIVARPWREDTALALAGEIEASLGGFSRPPV